MRLGHLKLVGPPEVGPRFPRNPQPARPGVYRRCCPWADPWSVARCATVGSLAYQVPSIRGRLLRSPGGTRWAWQAVSQGPTRGQPIALGRVTASSEEWRPCFPVGGMRGMLQRKGKTRERTQPVMCGSARRCAPGIEPSGERVSLGFRGSVLNPRRAGRSGPGCREWFPGGGRGGA
jgi:hypothetical protein